MFEYKILTLNTYQKKKIPQAEHSLNDLATEGWEPFMVSSSSVDLSQTVFLRRPSPNSL